MFAGIWRRLTRGNRRVWHAQDWPEFAGADWCDRIMAVAASDRFHAKQGRTIARWTLAAGGRQLVVYLKRHYRLPRRAGLLSALLPFRAWSPGGHEWHHLAWAKREGVPVPRPVAAGEFLGPWGNLQSFVAIEELAGMLPLHEAIPLAAKRLSPATFVSWKRGLIAEMSRIARLLHDRKHYHKDFYLCHFYIPDEDTKRIPVDWNGRVNLIDLHRLERHPFRWFQFQAKDLAQLLYSSDMPGVTSRDRIYFWRCYRGGLFSTLLRRIAVWKALQYRRHHKARNK